MGKEHVMSTSGTVTEAARSPVNNGPKGAPPQGGWAHWVWPGLVIALLGAQLGMGAVAVTLATADPAWRVVPHYHEQALQWDGVVAARAASDRLGWNVSITPDETRSADGRRSLTVTLVDSLGRPVEGATVTVELWHHARPDALTTVRCEPSTEPGRYLGAARMNRTGLWQVEIAAQRRDERFAKSLVVDWKFAPSPETSALATATR
jgi:nitrogen fixation protein FixH